MSVVMKFEGREVEALKTFEIKEMLGIDIGVRDLKSLGFEPIYEDHTRVYWQRSDFPRMCAALASHVAARASA